MKKLSIVAGSNIRLMYIGLRSKKLISKGIFMNLQQVRHVDDAITSRHSVRAFLNKAVDPQIIKDILTVASRAPSGTNTQP